MSNVRFKRLRKGLHSNLLIGISSSVKNYERTIICIKEGEQIYKVVSIQSAKKDGSINVFFPYCKETKAFISQHNHNYSAGQQKIRKENITKECLVELSTKLSLHPSGFVQLSGRGIMSGIDSAGNPKGIGVFSAPFDTPVTSGPTFNFMCWGVNTGFEILDQLNKNVQYILLEKEKDFVKLNIGEAKENNTYLLEFFIFPTQANDHVYEHEGKPYIDHTIHNYVHNPGATFTETVIDLKYFKGVLALFPQILWTQFPDTTKTGYMVGSPGGTNQKDKISSEIKGQFHLICPRIEGLVMDGSKISTLEFKG